MSIQNLLEKVAKCEQITLTNNEWTPAFSSSTTSFHVKIAAPSMRIICNLGDHQVVKMFIEIISRPISELKLESTLSDYSRFELICFVKDSQFNKLDLEITSIGLYAYADVRTVTLSNQKCENMIKIVQNHESSFSQSMVKNTAVLDDYAEIKFDELIKIDDQAHDTKSSQNTRVLSLSDSTHTEIIPSLEIANNQVFCEHGASIGNFDKTEIYYMQSRGLPKICAQNLLIDSYVSSTFDGLEDQFWQDMLETIDVKSKFCRKV